MEQGPGVSTNVIARHLGVSQATLFKRFGTKEQLLINALCPDENPAWLDRVAAGPDPDVPLREQLDVIMREAGAFVREVMRRVSVLRASGLSEEQFLQYFKCPPPVKAMRGLAAWCSRAQAQGRMRVVEPTTVAMMIMGSLHMPHFLARLGVDTETGSEERQDAVLDVLFRGLEP